MKTNTSITTTTTTTTSTRYTIGTFVKMAFYVLVLLCPMIVVVESSSVSFQGAQLDNDVTLYAQPIPNKSWIQANTNSFGTTIASSGNYVVVGDPTYKTQFINGKQ